MHLEILGDYMTIRTRLNFSPEFRLEAALLIVDQSAGLGFLIGSIAIATLAPKKHSVKWIMHAVFLVGIALLLAVFRPSVPLIAVGAFFIMFDSAVIVCINQVIWQTQVPVPIQGRFFGLRNLLSQFTYPVGFLIAAPLVDSLFNPYMGGSGNPSEFLVALSGVGEGRGIALVFLCQGCLAMLTALLGSVNYRFNRKSNEQLESLA